MDDLKPAARLALRCLDLTNLNDDCDEGAIRELAGRAATPYGHVAALCVWPRFVKLAKGAVQGTEVKIATVVNFPTGDEPASEVCDMTEAAVADGADEIDLVVPYKSFLEGREEMVTTRVERVKRAAGLGVAVKAILETGVLQDQEKIRRAADLAIEGGADFIKTSTGKVAVNATLRAARTMLEAVRDAERPVGFKPAGGVKTTQDAANYLELCEEIMGPGWATPETFRFGASGVLDALIATLSGEEERAAGDGY
ncbi:MAG: deoxyribose-phosphate aldolase [Pseudomonadota bacterium]